MQDEKYKCPVCWADFRNQNVLIASCGHSVCFDCVVNILKLNKKYDCCLCRHDVITTRIFEQNN